MISDSILTRKTRCSILEPSFQSQIAAQAGLVSRSYVPNQYNLARLDTCFSHRYVSVLLPLQLSRIVCRSQRTSLLVPMEYRTAEVSRIADQRSRICTGRMCPYTEVARTACGITLGTSAGWLSIYCVQFPKDSIGESV